MTGDAQSIRATFETWVKRRPDGTDLAEMPGKMQITIRLILVGSKYRYACYHEPFEFGAETFAESKLEEAKDWVRKQFRKQVTDWS